MIIKSQKLTYHGDNRHIFNEEKRGLPIKHREVIAVDIEFFRVKVAVMGNIPFECTGDEPFSPDK